MSEADIIIGTILMLALDAIDFVEVGIPGTDLVGFPLEQLFLSKKGVKGTTALIGNVIELIPGVDYLPVRSITWLITVWMDQHPSEFSEKMEQVGEVVQKAEGKAGAGAGQGALQAEGKAAEGAAAAGGGAVAQRGGAQGVGGAAEGSATAGVAAEGAGGEGTAHGKPRQGSGGEGGGEGGNGEEGGQEEGKKPPLAPEDQELEDIMSGDPLGKHLLRAMSAEDYMNIGKPEGSSRFNPNKEMGPEMETKGPPVAKRWSMGQNVRQKGPGDKAPQNNKGIINSEQVDLKKKKPENKEFLQDAA